MSTNPTSITLVAPHQSPLLWSFIIQIICSLFICYVAHHTCHRVKRRYVARVEELDRQLRKMEVRLRMQQPNISLITQIAHKMSMPLDEETGEKKRMMHLVEGTTTLINKTPSTDLLPAMTLPQNDCYVEPEGTQLSSTRQVKSNSRSRHRL